MKKLCTFVFGLICLMGFSAMPPQAKLTRQREAEMRKGPIPSDMLLRPAKGKIAIINSQKDIDTEVLVKRAKILEQTLCSMMKIEEESEPFSLNSANSVMMKHSADIAFFLVDSPDLPMSLTCLEGWWGMVNLDKLRVGDPDKNVLIKRFSIELNRVIRSLLNVSEHGNRPISQFSKVKSAPKTAADLDLIKQGAIPMDCAIGIHGTMATFGIYAERLIPYDVAVQQGWAPPPTNDVQKAIWDEVHSIPEKPMKIKFDPTSQKGKVTK